MNKQTILIAILAIVVLVGAGIYAYIQRTLSFDEPPTYDASVISGKPEGATCLGAGIDPGLAIELLDLEKDVVYLSGGENPISEATWDSTQVRFPHMKNSKRYILFDSTCFFRSPDEPAECQGEACFVFEEIYGHSWFQMVRIAGQRCYPDAEGCESDVVKPGYVSITTIEKCQENTFAGPTINVLSDGQGNRYVMHATDDNQPDIEGVPLPEGWTLSVVELDAPLTLQPRGEGHCYYNIVRDANLQSYHQYVFAQE
jgi:hypothetical protein